jgi:NAD(P)-dependent dehydrogenase (short-subunit alcohol dehydrogenase family)
MEAARFERVFATNITGAFLCAREAVRRMSTRHGGAGRRHRERLVDGLAAGIARRIRRLRRVEGRHRLAHHRLSPGKSPPRASA